VTLPSTSHVFSLRSGYVRKNKQSYLPISRKISPPLHPQDEGLVPNWLWQASEGEQRLCQLLNLADLQAIGIDQPSEHASALTAINALLSFTAYTQGLGWEGKLPHIPTCIVENHHSFISMDAATRQKLRINANLARRI
jgi:DNA mismatch repair protein MutS